jgi:hypothetical protein
VQAFAAIDTGAAIALLETLQGTVHRAEAIP